MTELQMAVDNTGAPTACAKDWETIDWQKAETQVKQLQMRIAKAVEEKRWNKVNSLQWILTHSFFAKIHAVRRITKNKGSRTPGVDKVLLHGPKDYVKMALSLQRQRIQGFAPEQDFDFLSQNHAGWDKIPTLTKDSSFIRNISYSTRLGEMNSEVYLKFPNFLLINNQH